MSIDDLREKDIVAEYLSFQLVEYQLRDTDFDFDYCFNPGTNWNDAYFITAIRAPSGSILVDVVFDDVETICVFWEYKWVNKS